ncbi:hypothetical protein CapIbe_009568 [Capra ibex]
MAGRGRDSESVEAQRARAGEGSASCGRPPSPRCVERVRAGGCADIVVSPAGPARGPEVWGPLLGQARAPFGSLSASRREGGAPGQPQHPGRTGPIPGAALGEKRKEAGTEVAAWGRRSGGG